MLSQEEIDKQEQRLTILRQNLIHLLQQADLFGGIAFAPLPIVNSIAENRREIRSIKESVLRHGVVLESAPVDQDPAAADSSPQPGPASGRGAGSTTVINTGGGDYAGRNIYKTSSVEISGGTIYGPVVGYNAGTISSTSTHTANQLELVQTQVQALIAELRASGDADTADDLESVQTAIRQALKAQREGRSERRLAKLSEARQSIRRIAADSANQPSVQALANSIEGIA